MDINEVIQSIYTKNEQAAAGAHNKKFSIAFGITNDLMKMLGSNDIKLRNKLFHRIIGAMDESDRRWYNDVCGELHKILTGTETDAFTYLPHGLKKIWQGCTKPVKEFLAWLDRHNDGSTTTVGAQVDTSGRVDATFNNTPVYNIYTPPAPPQAPQSNPIIQPTARTTQVTTPDPTPPEPVVTEPEAYIPISIAPLLSSLLNPNPPQAPTQPVPQQRAPNPPQAPQPTTPTRPAPQQPASNTAADTARDLIAVGGAALNGATGYGGLGKIDTTYSILKEMGQDYGYGIKAWNAGIQLLLGKNPLVDTVTASCDLYKNHVSQRSVDTVVRNLNREASNLPDDARIGLGITTKFIQTLDGLFRNIANLGPSLQPTSQKAQEIHAMGVDAERNFNAFVDRCSREVNNPVMDRELQDAKTSLHIANTLFNRLFGANK